ncbi:hypothetical protein F5Y12DRAFT_188019 [Xylaria sp. FL1777]|nr:hypothetical protein F5Y12DRAFT_188019 [Xylaria sp. FL1777]
MHVGTLPFARAYAVRLDDLSRIQCIYLICFHDGWPEVGWLSSPRLLLAAPPINPNLPRTTFSPILSRPRHNSVRQNLCGLIVHFTLICLLCPPSIAIPHLPTAYVCVCVRVRVRVCACLCVSRSLRPSCRLSLSVFQRLFMNDDSGACHFKPFGMLCRLPSLMFLCLPPPLVSDLPTRQPRTSWKSLTASCLPQSP